MEIPTSKTPTVDWRFFTILQKVATRPQKSDFVQKQYIYTPFGGIFRLRFWNIPNIGDENTSKWHIYTVCTKSHFCGRVATFFKTVKKRQSTDRFLEMIIHLNLSFRDPKKPFCTLTFLHYFEKKSRLDRKMWFCANSIYIRHLEVFFVSDSGIFLTSVMKIPQNCIYILFS